jgi:hypothetical protein
MQRRSFVYSLLDFKFTYKNHKIIPLGDQKTRKKRERNAFNEAIQSNQGSPSSSFVAVSRW